MYLKTGSHSVSVEDLKVAPTAVVPLLPTQPSHTQKINRNLNVQVAIFHSYQNVPADHRNPLVSIVLNNIHSAIFIYFLC